MKRIISLVLVLTLGLTAAVANADFIFGEPTNLGQPVNSSYADTLPSISADGLEMYFDSYNRPGGYGGWDTWVTRRKTIDDDWSTPVNLGPPVNSSAWDGAPCISADELEFYFCSQRPGGYGGWDILVTRRATKDDTWGQPTNLGSTVNSSAWDACPSISAD